MPIILYLLGLPISLIIILMLLGAVPLACSGTSCREAKLKTWAGSSTKGGMMVRSKCICSLRAKTASSMRGRTTIPTARPTFGGANSMSHAMTTEDGNQ